MPAPSAGLAARHARLRDSTAGLALDALVVSARPNILYLSNLYASTAVLVLTADTLYLITDFRYSAAVERLLASEGAPPSTVFVRVETSYDETMAEVLARAGASRVGFESPHVSCRQLATWTRLGDGKVPGPEFVPTDGLVEQQRLVKDASELEVLKNAADRLSEVARAVVRELAAPGRTERDLAAEIDWRMKRAGFDRPAFDTIVAAGPNSALPHAHPSDRIVEDGDLLLFDFGGELDGYCVDLTRTVAVGAVSSEQRRLYRAVHDAQRAAIDRVRAGEISDRVDAAARDTLAGEGLAEAFGHSTGHGLGLEVHEEPRLGRRHEGGPEPTVLKAGMVCTIEPGAYVPGFGGVRLEDDVAVTAEGCDILTDVPYDERLL